MHPSAPHMYGNHGHYQFAGSQNVNIAQTAGSYSAEGGAHPQAVYMMPTQPRYPGAPGGGSGGAGYGHNMDPNMMYIYQPAQPIQQSQPRAIHPQMVMPVGQPTVYQQPLAAFGGQQWQTQLQYANMPYQQQQQPHYKKQGAYPGVTYQTQPGQQLQQQQQPSVNTEPTKRHKQPLAIIDPETGKDVLGAQQQQTTTTTTSLSSSTTTTLPTDTNTVPSPSSANVAVEFAAKVAATLASASHHQQLSDDQVPQHPPGAPQNLTNHESIPDDVPATDKQTTAPLAVAKQIPVLPKSTSDLAVPSSEQPLVEPPREPLVEQTQAVIAAPPSSVAPLREPLVEQTQAVIAAPPSSVAPSSESTEKQQQPPVAMETSTKKDESAGGGKDNRKKKNKKKTGVELNMKGKVGQGTDMDAFIDELSTSKSSVTASQQPDTAVAMDSVTVPSDSSIDLSVSAADVVLASADKLTTASETVVIASTESQDPPADSPAAVAMESVSIETATELTATESTSDVATIVTASEPVAVETEANVVLAAESVTLLSDDVVSDSRTETVSDNITVDQQDEQQQEIVVSGVEQSVEDLNTSTDDDLKDPTAEAVKVDLKYKYSEEQWSPLNPEGKKQYDRSFMLQLQYAQNSLTRPANLPMFLDIVLNEPPHHGDITRTKSMELNRVASPVVDFTPGFIKSSPSGSRRPRYERSNSSMKKGEMSGPGGPGAAVGVGRKVISLQIQQDVKLHTADNAWKPVMNKTETEDEIAQTEALYKKVRGILNKLTPQKFKTLIQQVLQLPINSEERLKGCIDIIFEKAISEPNFSVAYANMAKYMLPLTVPRESDPAQTVGFRTLLLNKCQQEFEKDKMEELDIAERQKLIDEATSDDKRKLLIEEQEQAASKAKRRSLGNIRFIGELFKLRMLTEMIMHDCLFKLLRSSDDEDNLECLCQLLTTIGQDLDNKQAKLQTRVDKYFQQLELLSNDRKTSARIRFMLLDTIDLRKNNWVPRREKNNPKTIEQIHKEAQEEAQEKQALIQRVTNEQRGRRLPPGPMGNVRGGAPSAGLAGNDDGWTAVSRPPRNNIVDPCRLKLTKREQVDDNVQLGPGGRGMSTWHRGSSGGGGKVITPEPDVQRPNRYSLLTSAEQTFDSRNRPTTAASGGGRPRDYQGRMSGPVTGRTSNMTSFRASTQDSMADTLTRDSRAGVRDFMSPMSSRSASREPEAVTTAPSRTVAPVPQATPKVVQQEMSTEELERKTKSIMEEYLHLNDIKEAELCVRELSARTKSMQTFVYNALTLNLERSTQARQMTGTLLYHVIKHGIITLIDYVQGLSELLSLVDDMVIDIPMIWQYLGELISPMIQPSTDGHTSSVPLEFLRDACQPLIDANNQMTAAKLVAVVINDAVHRMGHHQVAELWQQSSLEWSDFVPAEKLDEFLLAHELHFTVTLKPVPKAERKESSTSELLELLADTELDNDKVIDWIDENVGEVNETFVRALTTAVCRPAWKAPASGGSARPEDIDEKLIKKRISLLQKYVNHQPNLEMETLYAVQLIVHEHGHPYGALRKFFDLLYDDEVVSEESFYLWRDKPEVGEQTGRGCGKLTLDQFYNWLEEDTAS